MYFVFTGMQGQFPLVTGVFVTALINSFVCLTLCVSEKTSSRGKKCFVVSCAHGDEHVPLVAFM